MGLLELIIILFILGWFFGGTFAVGGSLINLLLVLALIFIVIRLAK